MLRDKEGCHRSADQGAHDISHGTGCNADGGGVGSAPAFKNGAEGGRCAYAAGHGGGRALEGQERMHTQKLA